MKNSVMQKVMKLLLLKKFADENNFCILIFQCKAAITDYLQQYILGCEYDIFLLIMRNMVYNDKTTVKV